MSEEEKLKEKKRVQGEIMVREWVPGPWRKATEKELEELSVEQPLFDVRETWKRFRRFWRKLDEAFEELMK